ncbi:hypothetical protein [Cereibacter sphaeroides]|uniref:hypothetical protein n=1 Tax=Cereibacter sphaeroides TaxID=1063 RepID=UPI001F269D3B|nr:hypothetical protein [Cereibacter sphaeroides]MCE6967256.1 hypothetical protein [Cereibacter sphaeroides]
MAHVFLFADDVLKLKKPVVLGILDHRTLAARHRACAAEVRLNRELAGGSVYRGLLPLVVDDGRMGVGGSGEVVDWLVYMQRLPADRMLDRLITERRAVEPSLLSLLMRDLASFYGRTRRAPEGHYLARLRQEAQMNSEHLAAMAAHVPQVPVARLAAACAHRIRTYKHEIARRERRGLIVDGHGDLRPEHVCLLAHPVVFDRVEFSRDIRLADPFDEVGHLALECGLLGAPDLAGPLLVALDAAGVPAPSAGLLATYRLFRCLTRARLCLDHLRDEGRTDIARWIAKASAYLAEATRLVGT